MDKIYHFSLTPPAWFYVRRALGMQPHDEAHPLIVALEQVVAEQDEPAEPVPKVDPLMPLSNPLKHNGSAIAEANHAGDSAP